MKRIITLFLACLVLVSSLAFTAFAAGSVTYEESASKFIFKPGSDKSPTDLFEGLKGVMPGDKLNEQIVIKNDPANKVKIKVYLRSLGAQEGTDEFLKQMTLKVTDKNDSIMFNASADQTAQLTDWVYLGTVYSGGTITLDLELDVPITMGNDFQDKVGYIDWQFKIEELPIEPTDPENPSTGDTANLILWGGLMIASCAAIFLIMAKLKKEKLQNK